jgi:hypothetical protein
VAGKGVPLDDNKAEQFFSKACRQKHLQSCYHHALLLYDAASDLDHKKKAEALQLLDWSCKEGEYESCYFAGSHYLNKGNFIAS